MGIDVAVVGFVVFTILGPLGGGYLAAWLLDATDSSRFARGPGDEIQDDGPLSLGGAVGWVGLAMGAVLFAGTSIAAWPAVDPAQIARIAAGAAGPTDWLAAAFPVVARILIASIAGILVGAVWSTFGGPVAQMERLEAGVEQDLDDRAVVDAPAPGAGQR